MVILGAGYYLCLYGDAIADKTNLGRSWVGAILLGVVTSLPELAAGVSAITVTDAPDLVLGELLGSCVFNLLMLVMLDVMYRSQTMYAQVDKSQALTSAFGSLLIGFTGVAILTSQGLLPFNIGHIGWYSFAIPLFYFFAMKELLQFESDQPTASEPEVKLETEKKIEDMPLSTAVFRYAIAALVVVGAGIYLPVVAERISTVMGWNEAFVGTLFIALTTSLPEAAVTVSAISIGAIDLAFGNVVGSNLFNILIIPICDAIYTKGPILESVSLGHAVTALSGMVMSGLAIIGILAPPRRKVLGIMSWISVSLVLMYALNTMVLFKS